MSGRSSSAPAAPGLRVASLRSIWRTVSYPKYPASPPQKRGRPRLRRGPEPSQELAQERERIAIVTLDDAALVLDFDVIAASRAGGSLPAGR